MKKTLLLLGFLLLLGPVAAQEIALKQQAERVAAIQKVKPAVVAVFARGGQGGGTGVLISDDGYALTNFHVVQPTGPTMQCGLADGVLYDAVLVGQDKVGDVALIKLLPKKEGAKFPFAVLGDSDVVREGDWSIAMGNPFLLATDFTPTVTFGLVSGVHRYQYPAGTILEYTDCIQIDTSINPGNSGGPLFNMKGELIGINGRGSFDKRGRVNSGVGYAISINQIKNFMGHLHAGLDADHASLGALVTTQSEKTGFGKTSVTSILEDSDVFRRGMDLDDELLSFAGRHVTSVNHYKNVLGLYPRGWRVPLEFRREQNRKEILVRLMGAQRKTLDEQGRPQDDGPRPVPQPQPKPGEPFPQPGDQPKPKLPLKKQPIAPKGPPSPAAKYYEAKAGFANYYFNRLERERLLKAYQKHGDFSALDGDWTLEGGVRLKKLRSESRVKLDVVSEKAGESSKFVIKLKIDEFPYALEPLKSGLEPAALKAPETSGGLLSAVYLYRLLLTQSDKAFTECYHGGFEPFYPPAADGKTPTSVAALRVDCEVLNTRHGPYLTKWFFSRVDQKLLGFEVRLTDNEDPCEVFLSDYRPVDGRLLPHRLQVMYADGHYGTFNFTNFSLAK
ncbi:MAG: trypsin-like peptidase domain-containing protein [Gemmataceae bacterium]|nr:trypsin-like peptidase domain-containing protein [Gemmataceae bacterium]MCI0739782.1 trypsin-like peptidase domain-containing protein [Gemmataceae bacterium]